MFSFQRHSNFVQLFDCNDVVDQIEVQIGLTSVQAVKVQPALLTATRSASFLNMFDFFRIFQIQLNFGFTSCITAGCKKTYILYFTQSWSKMMLFVNVYHGKSTGPHVTKIFIEWWHLYFQSKNIYRIVASIFPKMFIKLWHLYFQSKNVLRIVAPVFPIRKCS